MKIEIYSRENCPQCTVAKNIMKSKCVEYNEIILDNQTVTVEDLKARISQSESSKPASMLPQIFVDDAHLGSVNDLREFIKSNELGCLV
jgi:glutaredoxin 3